MVKATAASEKTGAFSSLPTFRLSPLRFRSFRREWRRAVRSAYRRRKIAARKKIGSKTVRRRRRAVYKRFLIFSPLKISSRREGDNQERKTRRSPPRSWRAVVCQILRRSSLPLLQETHKLHEFHMQEIAKAKAQHAQVSRRGGGGDSGGDCCKLARFVSFSATFISSPSIASCSTNMPRARNERLRTPKSGSSRSTPPTRCSA